MIKDFKYLLNIVINIMSYLALKCQTLKLQIQLKNVKKNRYSIKKKAGK